jgi:hypothetical protein
MNTQTHSSPSCLVTAKDTLRDVLHDDFRNEANSEAASLDRMLIHLENMDAALEATPEVRANVIKRLGDFAVMVSRMAIRNLNAAPKLTQLANVLREASEQVRVWNQPEQPAA